MCILQKMVLDYLASCLMIEQIDILFWWSCRYYLIVMIEQIDILFSLPFISSVSALKLLGFRFYYISGRVSVHSVEVPLQNWSLISVEVPLHWSLASYLLDIVTTTGIPPLMFFSCLFLVNLVWLAHYFSSALIPVQNLYAYAAQVFVWARCPSWHPVHSVKSLTPTSGLAFLSFIYNRIAEGKSVASSPVSVLRIW